MSKPRRQGLVEVVLLLAGSVTIVAGLNCGGAPPGEERTGETEQSILTRPIRVQPIDPYPVESSGAGACTGDYLPCGSNAQCCAGVCNGGVCNGLCQGEGGPCEDRFNCCGGFTCDLADHHCKRSLSGAGGQCNGNGDCKSGLFCGYITHTCRAPSINHDCDGINNTCGDSDYLCCPAGLASYVCVFQDTSRTYPTCNYGPDPTSGSSSSSGGLGSGGGCVACVGRTCGDDYTCGFQVSCGMCPDGYSCNTQGGCEKTGVAVGGGCTTATDCGAGQACDINTGFCCNPELDCPEYSVTIPPPCHYWWCQH